MAAGTTTASLADADEPAAASGLMAETKAAIAGTKAPTAAAATVAAAALLALFADDAATVRDPGPPGGASRQSASKDDVRARLALLQGACPAARVSRQLTKELNNFFVSPNGGWLQVTFA